MLVSYSSSDDEEEDDTHLTGQMGNKRKIYQHKSPSSDVKLCSSEDPVPVPVPVPGPGAEPGAGPVQVKDQVQDQDQAQAQDAGRVRLAVPTGVLEMFGDEGHRDDPADHQGRVRTFAHERGNWATTIYAPIADQAGFLQLAQSLAACLRGTADFQSVDNFHVSLSRTFAVQFHWIEPLVDSLRQNLAAIHCKSCGFSGLQFYSSDERTRTFLGLQIAVGAASLASYVTQIDRALSDFRLPVYYKPASFHVSLVWALGDLAGKISPHTQQQLENVAEQFLDDRPDLRLLEVDDLVCRTGNRQLCLPLRH